MESVRSLEDKIAEVHKGLPHLPGGARAWIVANAWWIVLIGVILSAMGLFATLNVLITLNLAMSGAGGYGLAYAPFVGVSLIGAWVSLLFGAAGLVVEAMAISPLKAQLKRGWDLLFLASLISLVAGLVGIVLGNFFGISGVAIGLAIGWYFLFEVRDGFDGKTVVDEPKSPVDGPKKEI